MINKIALALALTLQTTIPALTAEINVMSGGAPKEALSVLIPAFEKLTGHHVNMTYAVISTMQQRLSAGEVPDMVLMPTSAIADLAKNGKLKAEGSAPFGTVKIVAIVKEGAVAPDISTPEAFRDTLLKARSLVYSNPNLTPSGAHMARLIKELNIAEEIEKKVTYRPALDGGVEIVAAGDAELGIYPSSEVIHVKGVMKVGALPEALQLNLVYGGAVTAANAAPEAALSFIKFLSGANNKNVWKEAGFDPS